MGGIAVTTTMVLALAVMTACATDSPDARPGGTTAGETSAPPGVSTPATGEVPLDLLRRIITDAASRGAVEETAVSVLRAESVTWSDGSLGCPQPGMNYTQATVPGYRVVLDVDGTLVDYRASERGAFTVCEDGADLVRRPRR